jgi:ectoine hydroxylase-related dioxygenase (phytanoyl-CoA dioxygenase family)
MHGSWTQVEESRAVDLETPAGTVVLFSANLLHGTSDNHSDRSRYSTAWHYIPTDLDLKQFPRDTYEDRFAVRPV